LKRFAGIDYGEKRIGLAISDPSRIIATPVKAIPAKKKLEETARDILLELEAYDAVEKIILGLPLMMSGKESPGSLKVRELAKHLEEQSDKSVELWDERLSTTQVERTMKEAEMSRKKRAKHVDAMAAAMILQSFLDSPCNK